MQNKKEEYVFVRMDKKLRAQLQRYADKYDEGIAAVSARKAIRKYIEEQE